MVLPAAVRTDLKTAILIEVPNGGPILNAARG